MDSQTSTSFEKEFNRLSFLASIATSDSNSTTTTTQQQPLNTGKSEQVAIKPSQPTTTAFNGHASPQKLPVVNGGLGSGKLDIEKINKILNSNAQASHQNQAIYLSASKHGNSIPINKNTIVANSLSTVTTSTFITTPITRPSLTSTTYIQPTPAENKLSTVTVRPPSSSITAASNLQTVNQPLIISSSPQKIQDHTAGGQTILLPANFAGKEAKFSHLFSHCFSLYVFINF